MLEVVTTLPPEFMCINRTKADGPESCQVQVVVIIGPGNDESCVAGETYPQAVVGQPNDECKCSEIHILEIVVIA